jgi:PKD repeat protein
MRLVRQVFPIASIILIPFSWGCHKNEPVPVARFTYKASHQSMAPCTVYFINQSTEAFSYAWWFGTDSSLTTLDEPGSEIQNPSCFYSNPGTFRVTLRAYNEARSEWASSVQTLVFNDSVK